MSFGPEIVFQRPDLHASKAGSVRPDSLWLWPLAAVPVHPVSVPLPAFPLWFFLPFLSHGRGRRQLPKGRSGSATALRTM